MASELTEAEITIFAADFAAADKSVLQLLEKDAYLIGEWKGLTQAERVAFVEGVKSSINISKNPFKAVYKFPLNNDKMGKMAINFRKANNSWHEGNVCVFEYVDDFGSIKYHIQETLVTTSKHSERLAIEALETQGIPLRNVKRIYSEYEPCVLESGGYGPGGCKKMLHEKIGTDITIHYSYDFPGVGSDAAAKLIREQSKAQKVLDFVKFK
jgi:Xanthomonas XOO_2897-like deaminase